MQSKNSEGSPQKARRSLLAPSHWPKWLRWTALGLLVIAIGAGAFFFIKARQAQASAAAQPALQTAVARQGDLTLMASGTGTLIAATEVNIGFKTSGILTAVNVKLGDKVTAGQLLAQLDDSSQQVQLAQAKQTLLEMTSPSTIATLQGTVAQDQMDVYNAQVAVNNLLYMHSNKEAIQNAYASMVLAQDNLSRAQKAYNAVSGAPDTDTTKARVYQDLYNAQLAYNSAVAKYNLWTGKSSQTQVDLKNAALALAKARLVEDQTLLAALTGGDVPENATGTGYVQLQQAKLNVQEAQDALDATTLTAPISGTVLAVNGQVGETAGSGTFITIADLSQAQVQIYLDESDWSNVKVGYTVNVSFDALPNETFTGKVIQVSPSLLSSMGSSVVEGLVQLDQTQEAASANPIDELPLGVTGSVDVISAQAKDAVLVPVQALHELSPGSYAVFIVNDGKLTLTQVEVGLQSETFAEIKSGVQVGDVVSTGIQATSK